MSSNHSLYLLIGRSLDLDRQFEKSDSSIDSNGSNATGGAKTRERESKRASANSPENEIGEPKRKRSDREKARSAAF